MAPQDQYTDPNWGRPVPAAPVAPAAPAAAPDYTDPQWGTPTFRTTSDVDAEGHAIARDDPGLWGRLQSAWALGNREWVPQIATAAHALADIVDRPMSGDQALNDRLPGMGTLSAQIRGFGAGMLQGSGDLASSMTSLVGAALFLSGLGEESAALKLVPALKPYLKTAPVRAIQRAVQGAAGVAFTGQGAKTALEAQNLGDVGRGLTQMAAGTAGAVSALRPTPAAASVPRPRLTPQEQASNAFAAAEGVPLDAATATGSRYLLAAEKRIANSMGGENTASELIARQQAALAAAGRRIAGEVNPALAGQPGPSVSPEQAGRAPGESLLKMIEARNKTAGEAYGALAALEADPLHAAEVPAPKPTQQAAQALADRMRASIGYAPKPGELAELRRMAAEMDNWRFTKRTWNDLSDLPGKQGNAAGGDAEIVAGAAGAPVYDDILKSLRSSDYVPTRAHVQRLIEDALETGRFTEVSKAAFDVAQRRLANDPGVSRPFLPPSAGEVPEAPPVLMGMPVALKPLQDAMRPAYERLMAEAQVAPLMGSKADAARILARVMTSPEYVPVSVADAVLGELKGVSRADVPALRTEGQALAAKAVKTLSDQIDEMVSQVPTATERLREGRTATVEKYTAAKVLDQLADKPVQTFDRLTAPRDQEIELLRAVRQQAPDVLPQLGRAKLDQWLDVATERGKFDHADRLYAEWQKMGDETKRLLFGTPARVQALDEFFLLAKRIKENPNPSGTAHVNSVFNVVSQVATFPLAKLLYTEGGVNALTGLLKLDPAVSSRTVSGAAREAAWARLSIAAQQAGVKVPLQFPRAAQADQPDQSDTRLGR